jgi:hypothetical protein
MDFYSLLFPSLEAWSPEGLKASVSDSYHFDEQDMDPEPNFGEKKCLGNIKVKSWIRIPDPQPCLLLTGTLVLWELVEDPELFWPADSDPKFLLRI